MGSPYEFDTTPTKVADGGQQTGGNGDNPFANQIYGSGARQAPYFEQGAPLTDVNPATIPNGGRATYQTDVPGAIATDQGVPQPAPTQVATNPERPQGRTDVPAPTGFSSGQNDLSGNNGSGGGNGMWYLDRAAMLGSSMVAAHRGIPGAEKFYPATVEALSAYKAKGLGATSTAIGAAGKDFLQTSAKTDLGKVLGGSFVATSILDMTLLSGRETSWKTTAVDVATPLLANALLGKYSSVLKVIGITAGAHSLEKIFFEDKKK